LFTSRLDDPLVVLQGLYNGLFALLGFWGCVHPVTAFGKQIQIFFCIAIVIAGLYGGATVGRSIWYIQAAPAAVALAAVLLLG